MIPDLCSPGVCSLRGRSAYIAPNISGPSHPPELCVKLQEPDGLEETRLKSTQRSRSLGERSAPVSPYITRTAVRPPSKVGRTLLACPLALSIQAHISESLTPSKKLRLPGCDRQYPNEAAILCGRWFFLPGFCVFSSNSRRYACRLSLRSEVLIPMRRSWSPKSPSLNLSRLRHARLGAI